MPEPELTTMRLCDAGASVAVALAAYGRLYGMPALVAVSTAERVLRAACVQEDKARGRRSIRMMGEVPVVEVMVAMGREIDIYCEDSPLIDAFEDDDDEDDPLTIVDVGGTLPEPTLGPASPGYRGD